MRRSKTARKRRTCSSYITVVTELNGFVDYTFDHLMAAKHNALRVLRARLLREGINGENGVLCARCGVRAYLECAENGTLILVESDGSPHRDHCHPSGDLARRVWEPSASAPLANLALRYTWETLQEAKALLQSYEAMIQQGEEMPGAVLEDLWALVEACEATKKRFRAISPDFYALQDVLQRLHRGPPITRHEPELTSDQEAFHDE